MIDIQPISESHLPFVQKYASHPSIGAMSTVPSPYPDDGAAQWYRNVSLRISAGLSVVFAIEDDGMFCGVMSLNGIDRGNKTAELDYWVAHELQGNGVATAAAKLAALYARDVLGVRALFSNCLQRNHPSGRVLEKLGSKKISQMVIESGKHKGECIQRFELKLAQQTVQADSPAFGGPAA